jgi:hypothetical protein
MTFGKRNGASEIKKNGVARWGRARAPASRSPGKQSAPSGLQGPVDVSQSMEAASPRTLQTDGNNNLCRPSPALIALQFSMGGGVGHQEPITKQTRAASVSNSKSICFSIASCFQAVLQGSLRPRRPPQSQVGSLPARTLGRVFSTFSTSTRPGTRKQPASAHFLTVFCRSATGGLAPAPAPVRAAASDEPGGQKDRGAGARCCARCEIVPAREQCPTMACCERKGEGKRLFRQPLSRHPAANNANRKCGLNKAMASRHRQEPAGVHLAAGAQSGASLGTRAECGPRLARFH